MCWRMHEPATRPANHGKRETGRERRGTEGGKDGVTREKGQQADVE